MSRHHTVSQSFFWFNQSKYFSLAVLQFCRGGGEHATCLSPRRGRSAQSPAAPPSLHCAWVSLSQRTSLNASPYVSPSSSPRIKRKPLKVRGKEGRKGLAVTAAEQMLLRHPLLSRHRLPPLPRGQRHGGLQQDHQHRPSGQAQGGLGTRAEFNISVCRYRRVSPQS